MKTISLQNIYLIFSPCTTIDYWVGAPHSCFWRRCVTGPVCCAPELTISIQSFCKIHNFEYLAKKNLTNTTERRGNPKCGQCGQCGQRHRQQSALKTCPGIGLASLCGGKCVSDSVAQTTSKRNVGRDRTSRNC